MEAASSRAERRMRLGSFSPTSTRVGVVSRVRPGGTRKARLAFRMLVSARTLVWRVSAANSAEYSGGTPRLCWLSLISQGIFMKGAYSHRVGPMRLAPGMGRTAVPLSSALSTRRPATASSATPTCDPSDSPTMCA